MYCEDESSMIVRRIKAEEYKRIQELMSLAFEFEFDNDKPAEDIARESRENPDGELDAQPECTWAAFEDDGSTMMGSVCAIPFTVNFDGHSADMYGIGGVNTLPMYRRRGCIRAIFERSLPAMYADGGVFSYLYPFSNVFYRAFGYERGCVRRHWTIKLGAIPKWDMTGTARLLEKGQDLTADARRVYGVWAGRYNMMTAEQNPYNFGWARKADPFKSREYTYFYYSKDGEPKGYMTFTPKNDAEGRPLECSQFIFADLEGFKGLLSLLKGFASDHECVSFRLPDDIDWLPLIPEASFGNVKCETESFGMVRVINVQKALLLASARGEGELVLDISDVHIPENNGCFCVKWENGSVISAEHTEREPDLRMGIGDFSRLLLGRHDASAIVFMESIELHCSLEKVAGLFFKKPNYITKPF